MKNHRINKNQDGIALMVVLWVLVLLIGLATEFAFSMKSEVNTTRNYKNDAEAYHLAKAGIQLSMAEILTPTRFHAFHTELGLVIGSPLPPGVGDQKESLKKIGNAYRTTIRKNIPLGRGTVSYILEDENSKIAINKAARNTLVKVLTFSGVKDIERRDIIVDSILDWIDTDKNHRLNGAESDFYQNLTPPYLSKNAPIENIAELIKVRGIDKEVLYGNDKFLGLDRFFTTYDVKTINPNTASPEVLSVMFTDSQAKLITKEREKKGFYNTTTSDYFRISSTGKIKGENTKHTIISVIQKISGQNGPKLLTHYWKDNSFDNITE